jgi:tetratricopeptide (TPR) repeat protein
LSFGLFWVFVPSDKMPPTLSGGTPDATQRVIARAARFGYVRGMLSWIRFVLGVCVMAAGVALNGCSPSGQSRLDEEKEPHFVLGKGRVNAMDYQGAIEAFEQSLEANSHSAAAHFELGWLYDEKVPDPAAAIYHYGQYLRFHPNADNAEVIRQRIYRCKQQLAADVLPLPSAPAAQQQLENLAEQNRQLQDEVNKWRAFYASQLAAAKTNTPGNATAQPATAQTAPGTFVSAGGADATRSAGPATTARPRTHTVVAGETAVGIARKYGVKLSALEAANPDMNPARIRVGQVLNIPPI